MDPYSIAALGSLGLSAFNSFFGPDPNQENRRVAAENRKLIEQRMMMLQGIFAKRGQYFNEAMEVINPKLAFADTQNRMAAREGAKAAQARLRRSMGSGGDIFGAGLSAGARTAATDRQNTLRALATGEAWRAAEGRMMNEVNTFAGMPIGYNPQWQPGRAEQRANTFANLGTSFGYLSSQQPQGMQWQAPQLRNDVGMDAHTIFSTSGQSKDPWGSTLKATWR